MTATLTDSPGERGPRTWRVCEEHRARLRHYFLRRSGASARPTNVSARPSGACETSRRAAAVRKTAARLLARVMRTAAVVVRGETRGEKAGGVSGRVAGTYKQLRADGGASRLSVLIVYSSARPLSPAFHFVRTLFRKSTAAGSLVRPRRTKACLRTSGFACVRAMLMRSGTDSLAGRRAIAVTACF